jgi:hypothetical protein
LALPLPFQISAHKTCTFFFRDLGLPERDITPMTNTDVSFQSDNRSIIVNVGYCCLEYDFTSDQTNYKIESEKGHMVKLTNL